LVSNTSCEHKNQLIPSPTAFKQCDKDGNNFIDVTELKEILRALGEEGTDTQAKELMKEIDDDQNGLISFDEFKEAMASWMSQ